MVKQKILSAHGAGLWQLWAQSQLGFILPPPASPWGARAVERRLQPPSLPPSLCLSRSINPWARHCHALGDVQFLQLNPNPVFPRITFLYCNSLKQKAFFFSFFFLSEQPGFWVRCCWAQGNPRSMWMQPLGMGGNGRDGFFLPPCPDSWAPQESVATLLPSLEL